jgi:hypothetical protein
MGALIASGEAVPLSAIEGVTAQQAEALAEHGISDIDSLAQTSVDDLVEFLDLSLDEAEVILNAARAVVAMRPQPATEETETHAVSAELDESMEAEVEPNSEMTAEGYDEAVENGVPFSAEPEINAWGSADPVAVTEAEPIPADELPLLESGRDLRPDTITPAPDITSSGVEAFESIEQVAQEVLAEDEEEFASEATTEEAETSAPAVSEDAASGGRTDDDENE